MRRPRAFTCSRLRAEPLPPPARKPLGYAALNEDSWGTILRSSSPCKCGGCGVDSSSSSPKTTPSSQRTRLPDSTTNTSTRHGWEAIIGTPPRPSDASPGLPPASRPDTPACERLSKFSPAARRLSLGETAPARRIVFASKPDRLDGDKTATTTTKIGNINHAAVGGSNSLSSERKRGSDGARSAPGNSRGMFSPPPGLSFGDNAPAVAAEVAAASASAATATAAAASCVAAATASTTSEKKCGGFSGPTCTMAPADVRAYAAAAAFASLASPDYGDDDDDDEEEEEEEDDDDDAVKGGGSRDEGWSFPAKQGFGAPVEGGSVPFGGAFSKPFTGVSAASSPNSAGRSGGGSGGGGGGSSNMKVDSLDEWKAPETGGIFSLGAPPQSNGFGRRRRMRVGG